MSTIRTDYAYFDTKNFSNSFETSGYAVDISPFTFIPRILDNDGRFSNKRIVWDFGDGSSSKSLCAEHTYLFPGKYKVTLFLYDSGGDGIFDSFSQIINVKNFVTDTISITSNSNYINEASHIENPFTLLRSNSWQTFRAVSADGGYTINLHVSGANAPLVFKKYYNTQKYIHLQPTSRFYVKELNTVSNAIEDIIIDNIITDNDLLYARLNDSGEIVFCGESDIGSTFVGTSGTKEVFFVDDLPDDGYSFRDKQPAIITANFDTRAFGDAQSFYKKYFKGLDYPDYAVIWEVPENTFYTVTHQLSVSQLTFTTNGIDGEGTNIDTFKINDTQYRELRIPVVIKLKDNDHYSTKYVPILSATELSASTSNYEIKIAALTGSDIISNINFITDFGALSSQQKGGFWKGYFVPSMETTNMYLSATVKIQTPRTIQYSTPIAFILNPNQYTLHNINIKSSYNYCGAGDYSVGVEGTDTIITTSLSSLTSIAVYPDDLNNGSFYSAWAIDNIENQLIKYDTFGNIVSAIDITSDLSYNSNARPSSLAIDGDKNIWVSLSSQPNVNEVGDVFRLTSNNIIDATASPVLSTFNTILSATGSDVRNTLSGNLLYPTCIDTDKDNNLWVAYSHPVSSILAKYNNTVFGGNVSLLSAFTLSGFVPNDIVVNYNGDVWVSLHDNSTTGPLSSYNDIIAYVDNNISSIISVSGRGGNIALSINEDAYIISNQSDIIKINKTTFDTNIINIPTTSTNISASDLKGIAGTAADNIIVVNDNIKKIIRIDSSTGNINESLSSINISNNSSLSGINEFNSNGDFTGWEWVNKYGRSVSAIQIISGISDTFDIFSETGRYNITKYGEDFDAKEMYRDLRFQETLFDDEIMFDSFIGTIVGNISSGQDTLGKRIHEKAENFADNIVNPDTCNIDALFSLYQQFDLDISEFDQNKFAAPGNFSRLVDLLSIKHSKLWGTRSAFSENFNINGYCPGDSPSLYGANLGEQLSTTTTILTASSATPYIVAHEIFSDQYLLINTNVLSSKYIPFLDTTKLTYALSSYDSRWGWGLTLPVGVSGADIEDYYEFYNYVYTEEGSQVEGIINWGDINNTLVEANSSLNEWRGRNQAMENILSYGLYKGMRLFTSAADIDY